MIATAQPVQGCLY